MTAPGSELRAAVERGEIEPWFQPQVDLGTRRIVAVEALARWDHPERGHLQPGSFVPQAERDGSIGALDFHMLDAGCRRLGEIHAAGHPVDIALNFSPAHLADEGFFAELGERLDRSGLPMGAITLEITEAVAIDDMPAAIAGLEALRQRGVSISIDDFGVGFSSRRRVDQLPIDEIKIDLSMVQDESDEGSEALREIVDYAHRGDLRVVAEGVETTAQFRRLAALGCDRAQGYLVARPVPGAEIGELIDRCDALPH